MLSTSTERKYSYRALESIRTVQDTLVRERSGENTRTERRQANQLLRTLVWRSPEEVHTLVRSWLQHSQQLHDWRHVREHRAGAHHADLQR